MFKLDGTGRTECMLPALVGESQFDYLVTKFPLDFDCRQRLRESPVILDCLAEHQDA